MNRRGGFSLLELIFVIVIICVMLAIAVPYTVSYVNAANEQICATNRATYERMYLAACASEYAKGRDLTLAEYCASQRDGLHFPDGCPAGGELAVMEDPETGEQFIECPRHPSGRKGAPVALKYSKAVTAADEMYVLMTIAAQHQEKYDDIFKYLSRRSYPDGWPGIEGTQLMLLPCLAQNAEGGYDAYVYAAAAEDGPARLLYDPKKHCLLAPPASHAPIDMTAMTSEEIALATADWLRVEY